MSHQSFKYNDILNFLRHPRRMVADDDVQCGLDDCIGFPISTETTKCMYNTCLFHIHSTKKELDAVEEKECGAVDVSDFFLSNFFFEPLHSFL